MENKIKNLFVFYQHELISVSLIILAFFIFLNFEYLQFITNLCKNKIGIPQIETHVVKIIHQYHHIFLLLLFIRKIEFLKTLNSSDL